jgi:uncharacterized membrane protein YozB (DUF420 family)
MDVSALPHLNAALNGTAAGLLLAGYWFVRRGEKDRHRLCMMAATLVSAAFLASYLVYHANSPIFRYNGAGALRVIYYAVLVSHVVLAALAAAMILFTVWRALAGRFDRHRAIARWTWPLWMYVSLSGIVVYMMLYAFNPSAGPA